MPGGDEAVRLLDVPGEQSARWSTSRDGGTAQHPAAHGGWEAAESRDVQGAIRAGGGRLGCDRPAVEGVRVIAGELGGAGQRLDDAPAQRLLQRGQRFVPDPGTGEGRISVVRVFPNRQRLFQAAPASGVPVDGKEWAPIALLTLAGPAVRNCGHAGQRTGAGASGEAEQDGFCLVIAGVAKKHGGGTVTFRDRVERRVAGISGGRLRATGPSYGNGLGFHRIKAEGGQPVDDFSCSRGGAGLKAVIDGDSPGAHAKTGRFEGQGGGEGHGVRSARARHQDGGAGGRALAGRKGGLNTGGSRGQGIDGSRAAARRVCVDDIVQNAANRQAYRGDRGVGTHIRITSFSVGNEGSVGRLYHTRVTLSV